MKSHRTTILHAGELLVAIVIAGVSSLPGAVDDTAPKDHSLFIGQNVQVLVDGEYRPVVGAGRRSFIVEVNQQRRELYTNKAKTVRVSRGLKLSTLSAFITSLKVTSSSDRAVREQLESMQNAIAIANDGQDRSDYAQGHMMYEEWVASLGGRFGATQQQNADAKSDAVAAADKIYVPKMLEGFTIRDRAKDGGDNQLLAAMAKPANRGDSVELLPEITAEGIRLSVSGSIAPATNAATITTTVETKGTAMAAAPEPSMVVAKQPAAQGRTIHDLADGKSDRLDFEFELSSPRSIENAYLIITTEYVAPRSPEPTRRVLAQSVGGVGPTPKKIRVSQADFPTSFHVNRYEISLYAAGQEVATNLSADRLDLSADEAYEYLVVDYLSSHKGATLPPAAVLMAPRSELQACASGTEFNQPVYVTVDKEGRVETLSLDSAGKERVSPGVRAVLQKFRFIPALDKGAPSAGRAKLVVADFTR